MTNKQILRECEGFAWTDKGKWIKDKGKRNEPIISFIPRKVIFGKKSGIDYMVQGDLIKRNRILCEVVDEIK